jgi:uncharacterized membrane protein YhaH (DUF805 family)
MFESRPIDVVTENNQLSSIPENPKNLFEKLFGFDGRTNRLGYLGLTILQIILFWIGLLASYFLAISVDDGFFILCIFIAFFYAVSFFAVGARRQHDFGRSGWFQLLGIIPVFGVFITFSWFFFAGEKGTNQYGEEPR